MNIKEFFKPTNKSMLYWLILGAVVLIAGGAVWWNWNTGSEKADCGPEPPVICAPDMSLTCVNGEWDCRKIEENEDISNWQTYRNEKYGFEMKYPRDWKLGKRTKYDSNSNSAVYFVSPKTQKAIEDKKKQGRTYYYTHDIAIYYYPSINDLGVTAVEELINRDIAISKIGQTELGGIQATEVIKGGEIGDYEILTTKDSHLYEISVRGRDDKNMLTAEERQILSTFKFLE